MQAPVSQTRGMTRTGLWSFGAVAAGPGGLDRLSALEDQRVRADPAVLNRPFRQVVRPLRRPPWLLGCPRRNPLNKERDQNQHIFNSHALRPTHEMTSRPTPLGRVMCRCGSKLASGGQAALGRWPRRRLGNESTRSIYWSAEPIYARTRVSAPIESPNGQKN